MTGCRDGRPGPVAVPGTDGEDRSDTEDRHDGQPGTDHALDPATAGCDQPTGPTFRRGAMLGTRYNRIEVVEILKHCGLRPPTRRRRPG